MPTSMQELRLPKFDCCLRCECHGRRLPSPLPMRQHCHQTNCKLQTTRTPVIITGSASGICTLVKIWNRVKPIPLALSSV